MVSDLSIEMEKDAVVAHCVDSTRTGHRTCASRSLTLPPFLLRNSVPAVTYREFFFFSPGTVCPHCCEVFRNLPFPYRCTRYVRRIDYDHRWMPMLSSTRFRRIEPSDGMQSCRQIFLISALRSEIRWPLDLQVLHRRILCRQSYDETSLSRRMWPFSFTTWK